jgi:hypothetical protein
MSVHRLTTLDRKTAFGRPSRRYAATRGEVSSRSHSSFADRLFGGDLLWLDELRPTPSKARA